MFFQTTGDVEWKIVFIHFTEFLGKNSIILSVAAFERDHRTTGLATGK